MKNPFRKTEKNEATSIRILESFPTCTTEIAVVAATAEKAVELIQKLRGK